jgi:multicomponent Na+:H+ antiporter subunit G
MSAAAVLAGVLLLAGAAFVAIAALGLVRLPDLYLRMHSLAKAGTLGCGLVLTGAALALPGLGVVLRVVGAVAFLLVTAPVASHLIGRAAHRTGAPQWEGTVVDQWTEDASVDPASGRKVP